MPFEKFPHPPRYEPLKKALITLLGNDKMYQEMGTVFENRPKSLIQDCERSKLDLHKSLKMPKNGPFLQVFVNLKLAAKQC